MCRCSVQVQLEHILPHALTESYREGGWTKELHKYWRNRPGNLVWQASAVNEVVANKPFLNKVQAHEMTHASILMFEPLSELVADNWTPEACQLRDREVLLAVASRLGIPANVMETLAQGMVIDDVLDEATRLDATRWPRRTPTGGQQGQAASSSAASTVAASVANPPAVTAPRAADAGTCALTYRLLLEQLTCSCAKLVKQSEPKHSQQIVAVEHVS